jgi:hypothetical protein
MATGELDRLQRLGERLRCPRFNSLKDAGTRQGLVHVVPPV